MLKKILLSLVLMLAGGLTASAQEYHYIGVQGSWWNPEYAGEGFALEEYGDGFMIAYWYTYGSMGEQMWLLGTGQREGNTVVLDTVRTSGGTMGDPTSSERVVEEPWGTVTLEIVDCAHINMIYESLDGQSGGYPMLRLLSKPLAAGSCNAIQLEAPEEPPPEEEPPPVEEPPPEEEPPPPAPVVSITLQKRSATGQWQDTDIPFWGLAVINKTYVGNPPRIDLFRFKILVEEGEMIIGNVVASEPTGISQPSVEGIRPGQSYPEGSEVTFRLESNLTGGERVYPYYGVHIVGFGQILDLTVRLSTQTL